MRVDAHGVTLLQQMLAQEELEASSQPKSNAGSAAQRGQRARRHSHAHGIEGEMPQLDIVLENPLNKARARALANKLRMRRRRSAESPDIASSPSELDELLMMLEEHTSGKPYPVIRASSQKKRDNQNCQSGQSEQSVADRYQDLRQAVDATPTTIDAAQKKQADVIGRYITQTAIKGMDGNAHYADLEQALFEIRALKSGSESDESKASLTSAVLQIMREFLARSSNISDAPTNLKAVREQLIKQIPHSTISTSAALRQMHFFLPILLLNASRPRTPSQRNLAIAKIAVLLRRGTL